MSQIKFYVYLWLREDGMPYYVGKGSGRRAYEKHQIGTHSSRVIIKDVIDEQEAFQIEEYLVNLYGRLDLGTGCLRNKSAGGFGGSSGAVRSEEFRSNLSRYMRGNKRSVGKKNALGNVMSEEARHKISQALIGNTYSVGRRLSESHKKSISKWCKNRPAEMLKQISESLKGNKNSLGHKHTEVSRAKMSQLKKGKPWSEARRAAEIKRASCEK